MKVLSILQPWASLVVTKDPKTGKAYKQIETRSWNTKYRGPLLIHAGIGKQYRKLPTDGPLWMNCPMRLFESMPFGAIIGMVNLVDTFPMETAGKVFQKMSDIGIKDQDQEIAFGDYSTGRTGWILSDPILFQTPIPCKGNLSIWNLPAELEGKVWEQIYAAKGQTGMVAIIYHTNEYQRKSVHYTAELGTDRADDLIKQTTELINKMGNDSRYSIQYFSKEEYGNVTELVAGTASSEKVHVSGSCHIPESAYQPTQIATPGEGAVVVEGVKECDGNCGMNYCDENGCIDRKRNLVEPGPPGLSGENATKLTFPDNSTDALMEQLRKSEIN